MADTQRKTEDLVSPTATAVPATSRPLARPGCATHLGAILTVHNRRSITVRSLRQITAQAPTETEIVVVDDGSTDGTFEAIRSEFPHVVLLRGDGNLFWGGGMARAEREILARRPSAVLWVNDDADLDQDALSRLISVFEHRGGRDIVCGAMRDPDTGEMTYSGMRRVVRRGIVMQLNRVAPQPSEQTVDTFNGNLVLIPVEVINDVGGIDAVFTHHYGDVDLGLRATAGGHRVVLAPGTFGVTSRNSPRGTFRDAHAPRRTRASHLVGPRGFPPLERWTYLRRHGTPFWPLQWAGFYILHFARIVLGR